MMLFSYVFCSHSIIYVYASDSHQSIQLSELHLFIFVRFCFLCKPTILKKNCFFEPRYYIIHLYGYLFTHIDRKHKLNQCGNSSLSNGGLKYVFSSVVFCIASYCLTISFLYRLLLFSHTMYI